MKKISRVGTFMLAIVMVFTSTMTPAFAASVREGDTTNASASNTHSFVDVSTSAWYHDYVQFVYTENLKNGISADAFSPLSVTSRAMVATVLYRAAGSPAVAGLTNPFRDVVSGTWYTDAIVWAANSDVVNGIGGGRFAPHVDITRQDLATMMARFATFAEVDLPATRTYTGFVDSADIADYASVAVRQLFEAGIINGFSGNRFAPIATAQRAEFAAMLTRFLTSTEAEYIPTPDDQDSPGTPSDSDNPNGPNGPNVPPSTPDDSNVNGDTAELSILGVSVERTTNTVLVEVIAGTDAYLDVSIYEDNVGSDDNPANGNRLANVIAGFNASEDEDRAIISVSFDLTLPEYFVVVAQIVDSSGAALSEPFTYIGYTQAFEEFSAKTVDDFDAEQVISLDDSLDNNFMVAADGVQIIHVNRNETNALAVNENQTVFTVANADYTVLSLEVGDRAIFSCEIGQGLFLVEVLAFSSDGPGAVTITSAGEPNMEEFLDFIKIDVVMNIESPQQDFAPLTDSAIAPASLSREILCPGRQVNIAFGSQNGVVVPPIGVPPITWFAVGSEVGYDFEGLLGLSLGLHMQIQYAPRILGSNALFDIRVEYSVGLEAYFYGFAAGHVQISVLQALVHAVEAAATAGVAIVVPGLSSIFQWLTPVEIYIHIHTGGHVAGSVDFERAGVMGVIATARRNLIRPRVDFQKINVVHPVRDDVVSLEAGPSLRVAVELQVDVSPSSLVSVGLTAYTGVEVRGAVAHGGVVANGARHSCDKCVRFGVYRMHEVFVGARVGISFVQAELTLVRLGSRDNLILMFNGYTSVLNNRDSIHGGRVRFGWGVCPNLAYRIEIIPQNMQGQALSNAEITVVRDGGRTTTHTREGVFNMFLYPGVHTVTISHPTYYFGEATIIVGTAAQTLALQPISVLP